MKKNIVNPVYERTCFEYFAGDRPEVLHLLPPQYNKVLEIGCAEGNFRKLLLINNEYWGVEPHVPSANIAKTKLDKVLIGTYDEVATSLPDNYFDLVLCLDVIEHIAYPELFLQAIQKKMTKNCFLVASIPNIRFIRALKEILIDKDFRYRSAGIFDNTHLRFFTKKSIIRLFNENGFSIHKIDGLNPIGGSRPFPKNILHKLIPNDMKFQQFGVCATLQ